MRAAIVLALLLAGCASPAPQGRNVPLDVPPARDLLPEASELPEGYAFVREAPQDHAPWRGLVDGRIVEFQRMRPEARWNDTLAFGAYSFETSALAHEMFANVTAEDLENRTAQAWGDEAVTTHFEMRGARDRALFLRVRSVVWIAQDAQSDPYRDDLPPSAWPDLLLPRLDAKA